MTLPAVPDASASKREWRVWAKRLRNNSPNMSLEVERHLVRWLQERGLRRVLAYRAFGSEVSLNALPLLDPSLVLYTTRANLTPAPHLTVHPWESVRVRPGWNLLEPDADEPETDPSALEAVLVPGLAFDRAGYRLGYGVGFYDRFLPTLPQGCVRVGVTTEALRVDALPSEPHDVPVDFVATEAGVTPVVRP
ncbi:5-formyltetrahydrofolate cyclo-ligase [Deinobacterium chartae]|uniref:5-formyltetrahydrofolate cyclo-ligase n=1 Tax=Deinobacterium chartae TaxID=521158 RepID=A0A841I689_9DEIO|nr:5-formyltetrahydrofolate cyclo-ligase [Deinobacterium chartae]MBB6099422.1 5-formyltetrahydrofolate cyclo-ligase [Deinobacterium chartae]